LTETEVEAVIGKPDKVEHEEMAGERSIAWHFKEQGLSLYFDEDADFRLVMLDIDNPGVSIGGVTPIGGGEDDVLDALAEMGEIVLEEELEDVQRRAYGIEGSGVWVWFHRELCDSVQISVVVDDEDEYVWPES
jgi:hypothetical protein